MASKSTQTAEFTVTVPTTIHDRLIMARLLDQKKHDIYMMVAEEMHKAFPYEIVQKEGKYSFKYSEGFPGVTVWISLQFPEWPTVKEVVDGKERLVGMTFNAVGEMKKAGKLSKEQEVAYDAINRFNSWYSGTFKLGTLREMADEAFQAKVKAKEKELLSELSKEDRKNEERVKGIHNAAVRAIKDEVGVKRAPRMITGKGAFNDAQFKNMADQDKAVVAVGLSKVEPDMVIQALAAAGRPVIPAKSLDELRASTLLEKLEARLSSGEFTKPSDAKKHIDALKKLIVSTAVTSSPTKAKVANA